MSSQVDFSFDKMSPAGL